MATATGTAPAATTVTLPPRAPATAHRWWAHATAAVCVASLVAWALLVAATGELVVDSAATVTAVISFAVVGWFLAGRLPEHRVTWVCAPLQSSSR
jgi:hypothetical protein